MKTALVTGCTGQDGSYLCELLLSKGYLVYGTVRRSSSFNTGRIDHIHNPDERAGELRTIYADLSDASSLVSLLLKVKPDEIYHLAAQSHVRVSFDLPCYTGDITGLGTLRLLEAVRASGLNPRFYNAASSEMFGSTLPPQDELSPFRPRSPYAAAKLYSYWTTVNYREAYGLFACNGILFNHESPRRSEAFVTRKITKSAARIYLGKQHTLELGNLDAHRDYGYAPDYCEAMWRMLQYSKPDDYVIGAGESHSVREILDVAFDCLKLNWPAFVVHDVARYMRPTEVDHLRADASKARAVLGWKPTIQFKELIERMVQADLEIERRSVE